MKFNNLFFKKYNDIFFTDKKIKHINSGYRLYFNEKNKKFYIINIHKNNEICYEFDTILKDIENILRFSNICNINKIIKNIEINNKKLEDKNIKNETQKVSDNFKERLYFNNRLKTIN